MITQRRERCPALRAALPAPGKVPDHLEPGQMRVIPPPSPRPRSPFPLLTAFRTPPLLLPTALTARAIARTRPLRRPPEQHPLQNRQVSPQPLQLSRLFRVRHPQPGVLLTQLSR